MTNIKNNKNTPTAQEIFEYMILHNADEAGENDKWDFEEAECQLLNSDKYHVKEEYKEDNPFTAEDFSHLSSLLTKLHDNTDMDRMGLLKAIQDLNKELEE